MKRKKDREYYQRKKQKGKRKSISEMTESEKRQQRKIWKKNSQKYRKNRKLQANISIYSPTKFINDCGAIKLNPRKLYY